MIYLSCGWDWYLNLLSDCAFAKLVANQKAKSLRRETMLGWTIWINILLFWFDSAVGKSKQFMAVELYLYMGETGLSKKNHLGKISKWWWWWWLGHNDNDDGLTMTSCVSNNDDDEEEEHKDSNTIIIMMVAWRWLNVLAIINNYWTKLSKISWFVCGEQINNWLLFAEV